MREKAEYRDILEQLNRMYPDREVLRTADCQKVMGCKSPKTVRAHLPMVRGTITKVALARALCR